MVSATSWSCKLSTPRSHRHQFCIAIARFSIQALRSLDHRNPTSAQRASSARSVSPLVCGSACLPASPPYACSSPSHANRSTGQRITTQSSTVLARREELAHRGEFFFLFFFNTKRKLSGLCCRFHIKAHLSSSVNHRGPDAGESRPRVPGTTAFATPHARLSNCLCRLTGTHPSMPA